MTSNNIKAHFIDSASGEVVSKRFIGSIPRVGDELRFADQVYYKVELVVHIYDEDWVGLEYNRVNIGVVKIENEDDGRHEDIL